MYFNCYSLVMGNIKLFIVYRVIAIDWNCCLLLVYSIMKNYVVKYYWLRKK